LAFKVRIHKRAEAEISGLSRSGEKNIIKRIIEGLNRLADDPFRARPGADILQLKSVDPKLYRLRIGKYRILYSINEKNKTVNVTMVIKRKKAYR